MSRTPAPRILQLCPADGWGWRFEGEPDSSTRRLSCFALVERAWPDGAPPEQSVEGVDLHTNGPFGLVEPLGVVEYVPPGWREGGE